MGLLPKILILGGLSGNKMHFAWELPVLTTNTVTNPASVELKLPCGILRKVEIYFDYGCDRLVRCTLFDGALQILPTNLDGYYALDGDTVRADIYHDLAEEDNRLIVYAWNVGTKYSHTLSIMCDVQGPDEPDLLAVMKAQVALMDRQIDLMKGMI